MSRLHIIVVAETFGRARDFLRRELRKTDLIITDRDWIYASDTQKLRGLDRACPVVFVPGWWHRSDAAELRDAIAICGFPDATVVGAVQLLKAQP